MSLKRKHDDEDYSASTSELTSHTKRRRSTLERGFSRLSLKSVQPDVAAPSFPVSIFDVPTTAIPALLPSSIEEPYPEPIEVPEIKMHNWYEPEKDRIVVTDLDDSDSEPESIPKSDIIIPNTLLDRIKESATRTMTPMVKESEMALVLFKPLSSFHAKWEGGDEQKNEENGMKGKSKGLSPPPEDDKMDIGP